MPSQQLVSDSSLKEEGKHKIFPIHLTDLWHLDGDEIVNLFSDQDLQLNNYQLNETGSFIWKLCDGKHSNYQIAELLLSQIEGEKPSLDSIIFDVNDFLKNLKKNQLIGWSASDKLDILLVSPPYPTLYSEKAINTPEYSAPPLGLAYIAAVLKENGYNVAIYDMHIAADHPEDIIKEYRKKKPAIVGITSTTPTYPNAVKVSKLLKAWDENAVIVIGGVHVTCLPEEALETNAFDYIAIGEGEQIMLDLADSLIKGKKSLNEVKGIAFKDSFGKIIFNDPAEKIKNLDFFPYPARDLLDMGKYFKKGSIVASRGCPYNCTYCACPVITGRQHRARSVANVLDEIEFIQKEYSINFFDFHDDTFNLTENRVVEFCTEIISRNMKFKWGCFCRATNFSSNIAIAMKDAGCEVVQFGVESGNQHILDSIRKKATLEEIEQAVVAAKKANISKISCGFIIGHSSDTEETIDNTIQFGIKLAGLGANRLTISVLTPYPGTDEFLNMEKNGLKLLTTEWEQFIFSRVVIETRSVTQEKLRELYARGIYIFLEATNN